MFRSTRTESEWTLDLEVSYCVPEYRGLFQSVPTRKIRANAKRRSPGCNEDALFTARSPGPKHRIPRVQHTTKDVVV